MAQVDMLEKNMLSKNGVDSEHRRWMVPWTVTCGAGARAFWLVFNRCDSLVELPIQSTCVPLDNPGLPQNICYVERVALRQLCYGILYSS